MGDYPGSPKWAQRPPRVSLYEGGRGGVNTCTEDAAVRPGARTAEDAASGRGLLAATWP